MNERAAAPRLARLTWKEAADWFREDPRLLLPVGSFLAHGPHLPLQTDTLITTALAEGIGARHGVLVAPALPYGAGSEGDRGYAGAGVLAHKALHRVLNDLVAGFEGQGLRELYLITTNGFGSHYRALVSVSPGNMRVRAIDTNVIDLSPVLRKPTAPERAGEVETSLVLYLAPDLVRKDAIEDVSVDAADLRTRMDGSEPVPLPGTNGVIGRPSAATAEKGRRIYEYLVQYIGDRLFPGEPDDT